MFECVITRSQECDVESQCWLLLYPVRGHTSWSAGGGEAALRLRTALPWIIPSFFFPLLFLTKATTSPPQRTCAACFLLFRFTRRPSDPLHSPPPSLFVFTPLRPALNYCMPIFPSLPSLPSPPPPSFISLAAPRPERALSPRRGSSALRERLRSSSPANQFPPESVTPVLLFIYF